MQPIVLMVSLLIVPASPSAPDGSAPTIAWPDFYARVSTRGLEYSATLRALAGRRVRLRGYSVLFPEIPGGVLLCREAYSDPHDVDETDLPYDAVGVLWRESAAPSRVPGHPTVEGVLRLGNRPVGSQVVNVTLEDAVPVRPQAAPGP